MLAEPHPGTGKPFGCWLETLHSHWVDVDRLRTTPCLRELTRVEIILNHVGTLSKPRSVVQVGHIHWNYPPMQQWEGHSFSTLAKWQLCWSLQCLKNWAPVVHWDIYSRTQVPELIYGQNPRPAKLSINLINGLFANNEMTHPFIRGSRLCNRTMNETQSNQCVFGAIVLIVWDCVKIWTDPRWSGPMDWAGWLAFKLQMYSIPHK